MRTFSEQTGDCTFDTASGWFSRIIKLTGILLFAMIHNPIPALSSVLPPSYSLPLAWESVPGANIAGYRVYYRAQDGSYSNSVTVGNVTTNTIPGLASGVTYFFVVTAYNPSGTESTPSNEVSYTPGVVALQISITSAGEHVLTVSGVINHTYEIQATQDFHTWTIIGTVTEGASGLLDFTDQNAASYPGRFYRTHDLQL
jgi:hypothetical protein